MPRRRRRSRTQRPVQVDLIWETTPTEPTCAVCSTPIRVSPHGRPRRFCSPACRQKHYRRHKRMFTDNQRYTDRLALRADRMLRSSERYRGRVDDVTPLFPNRLITRRDTVLLDLRNGFPLVHCQWCGIPMTRLNWHGPRGRCCSKYCQAKFADFLKHLNEALMRERTRLDPIVRLRLRLYNEFTREPQGVLRFEINVCDHCHKPYPVYGLTSRFCSKRCRQAAWRRTRRQCQFCGNRFKIKNQGGVKQVYCSKVCKFRSRHVRPHADRACLFCQKVFTPSKYRRNPQRFCSNLCKDRHARLERTGPIRERACLVCGTHYTPYVHALKSQVYCSVNCRLRAWRAKKAAKLAQI